MKSCLYFFGDILGYKNLLQTIGGVAVHRRVKVALDKVKLAITNENLNRQTAHKQFAATGLPSALVSFFELDAKGRQYTGKFEYFFAFDTLIIYLRDLEPDIAKAALPHFCRLIGYIYLLLLDRLYLKLRGVISHTTDYVVDSELITFGNIDECYHLERSLDVAAVCVHIPDELDHSVIELDANEEAWHCYSAPTKNGSQDLYLLNLGQNDLVQLLLSKNVCIGRICRALRRESRTCPTDCLDKLRNTHQLFAWEVSRRQQVLDILERFGSQTSPSFTMRTIVQSRRPFNP